MLIQSCILRLAFTIIAFVFYFYVHFFVPHFAHSVPEVDLKEILRDPLVHSFRFVPLSLCRAVSIILGASPFSNFSWDFRPNTVIPFYPSRNIIVMFALCPSLFLKFATISIALLFYPSYIDMFFYLIVWKKNVIIKKIKTIGILELVLK